MKVLVVDDSKDYVALLNRLLSRAFPGIEMEAYDLERHGQPSEDFDWSRYDLMFLEYQLGAGENGVDWLQKLRSRPAFPPTIILTAEGDEYVAVRAIRAGAADYVNKKDVSPERLRRLIESVLSFDEQMQEEQRAAMSADAEVLRQVKHPRKKDADTGYRFVRLIGKGAMSHVYLAERAEDGLSVVLKVLDVRQVIDRTVIKRFLREAELIAAIHSPFVVKIYEHGLTNKYGFIAMEFFARGDLKQRVELGITSQAAIEYMAHIAYGLEAVHRAGIVHRDLKPANIMFRGDDSLALADFGISKRLQGDLDLTTIGKVIGTPHYMSPEQGQGRPIDARSDIYSAGVLLYELLTGQKPFRADTPASLIYQHIHAERPPLPPALARYQAIVDRCMAKDPGERYQTAAELAGALEAQLAAA
jgi:CheY-like chemotaxis protein